MGRNYGQTQGFPIIQSAPGATGSKKYTDSSKYANAAGDMLMNDSFKPTSQAETNYLNELMDVTAGRSAVRGLGAPTMDSLAKTVAPELLQLRGMDVNTSQALMELAALTMPQTIVGSISSGSSGGWK